MLCAIKLNLSIYQNANRSITLKTADIDCKFSITQYSGYRTRKRNAGGNSRRAYSASLHGDLWCRSAGATKRTGKSFWYHWSTNITISPKDYTVTASVTSSQEHNIIYENWLTALLYIARVQQNGKTSLWTPIEARPSALWQSTTNVPANLATFFYLDANP